MYLRCTYCIACLLLLLMHSTCSPTNKTTDKNVPHKEQFCPSAQQNVVNEKPIDTGIALMLTPPNSQSYRRSCKREFSSVSSDGFIVKLIHPSKSKASIKMQHDNSKNKYLSNVMRESNGTISCPLTIYTINAVESPPWRIDPCQVDVDNQEPTRLMSGRLKIVWSHNGVQTAALLVLTKLVKGYQCIENEEFMHSCLKLGQETLFCVPEKLRCDGIRNCPTGNEYNSDEDPEMCSTYHPNLREEPESGFSFWRHFSREILGNILPYTTTTTTTTEQPTTLPTLITSDYPKVNMSYGIPLSKELSRYGPWGYLMLGLVLSGGVLLICGLWECCGRSTKTLTPNDDPVTAENSPTNQPVTESQPTASQGNNSMDSTDVDFNDPPPSYSTLFPIQKTINLDSDSIGPPTTTPPRTPTPNPQIEHETPIIHILCIRR